jgi:hypothetical protein
MGVTVTEAVPLFPSLVAVICAKPGVTAVTSPFGETIATFVLSDDQVTMRPLSALLLASIVVAVSCRVSPATTLALAGLTITDATGTDVTVTDAVPL